MKIKVDAELWLGVLDGANDAMGDVVRLHQELEATHKAYMMLTAAHDTALLAATEMVLRPTVVQGDVTLQIRIDTLEEELREAQAEGAYSRERQDYWMKRANELQSLIPIRKDMDAPGMY